VFLHASPDSYNTLFGKPNDLSTLSAVICDLCTRTALTAPRSPRVGLHESLGGEAVTRIFSSHVGALLGVESSVLAHFGATRAGEARDDHSR